jgi:TIR domain-containing protein
MERPWGDLPPTSSRFDYDAFISYRTGIIPDALVGEELQKVLESYPVPRPLKHHLVHPSRFRSRLKVFRDITDLSAGGDLGEAIKGRLRTSRWLVVVCSPDTPRSPNCTGEVRYFEEQHGTDRILLLLIAGEPDQSFPTDYAFRDAAGGGAENHDHTGKQPLAADIRARDAKSIIAKLRGRGIPKSKQARFKILAPLLGCTSPDSLIQRHRARVRRLALQWISSVIVVACGIGWIVHDRIEQETIRKNAERVLAAMGLEDTPTESELHGLWNLASQTKDTRLDFLKQAVRVHPWRFNKRATMMTRAAVGIDSAMAQKAEKAILAPLRGMEPANTDAAAARALLGLNLPIRDSDFIVAAYRAVLDQSTFHDVTILDNPTDILPEGTIISRSLCYQFWRRIRSLDEAEQKAVVARALQSMKDTDNPLLLSRWALLLGELKGLTSGELITVTTHVMTAVSDKEKLNQQSSHADQQTAETILKPYAALWKNAGWEFSREDVKAFVPLIITCLQGGRTIQGIEEWRDQLMSLLNRGAPNARAVATAMILAAMKNGASAKELDEVLVKVPSLLTPEFRKQRISTILDLITGNREKGQETFDEPSGSHADERLAAALSAVPEDLSSNDLSRVQAYFISLISQARGSNSVDRSLGIRYATEAIAALPKPLPDSDYWRVAADIVRAMKAADADSTTTDLETIAGASAKLPKPSVRSAAGDEVLSAITEEIKSY